jgi:hypothetical protein
MTMSDTQWAALRSLDSDDDYGKPSDFGKRTWNSLRKRGLVEKDSLSLTPSGKRRVRHHVRTTGNGPETLKARFRFF